jgi:uncharacterized glyoxalase superfamily protein PhnB
VANDPEPVLTPAIFYRDPKLALPWLEAAFGLEISMLITDDAGKFAHAELSWRGAAISVGGELEGEALIGPARMKSPISIGGVGTQFIRLAVEGDIDAHCEHARAAGAKITQAPKNEFYGARTYRALDLEGHVWTFTKDIEDVSIEAMEKASGLKIETREQPA